MSLVELSIRDQILASTLGLQLLVPIVLLAGLALARPAGRASWLAGTTLVAAYLLALGVVGQFGQPLPWFTPYLYAALAVPAAVRSWRRVRPDGTRALRRRLWTTTRFVLALTLIAVTAAGLVGYRTPSKAGASVDLHFPLDDGLYYVGAGGSTLLINHHLVTLDNDFRADYRGQSYGVDIIQLGTLGISARGLIPDEPGAYAIFGKSLHAPCAGQVVRARDGAPDMPPPQRDLSRPLGNHVFIACKGVVVVLAHLQEGSVSVKKGQRVAAGQRLGRVGNSGQTTAPHLHIHAQRQGKRRAPLAAEPVPITFDGRYLVRNSLVWRP